MNDLHDALHEHAHSLPMHPDVDDVFRRIDRRRRRQRAGGMVAAVAVVAAAGVGVVAIRHNAPGSVAPAASDTATSNVPATEVMPPTTVMTVPDATIAEEPQDPNWFGALRIDGMEVHEGSHLDRYDAGAADGPQTWTFRQSSGALAFESVVVTFPVDEPTTLVKNVTISRRPGNEEEPVTRGYAGSNHVVWPVGGAWARIRGDFDINVLSQWAASIDIVDGVPRWTLDGIQLKAGRVAPYRATHIHEVRYGSTDSGHAAVLGNGLLYTGLLEAGGFEDALYAGNASGGYTVHGHPAVVSGVQGGNATISWQVAPGLFAYVGYSGLSRTDAAIEALVEIANRTQLVDKSTWEAGDPQVVPQVNDFGMGS